MINKKGSLVLRDMLFMMMIVSSIFVFAGLFVSEMATNYENTDMSDEWAITGTNTLANSTFYDTSDKVNDTGKGLSNTETGLFALLSTTTNTLQGIGDAIFMVLLAPNTIADLISGTLVDIGVDENIGGIIKFLIATILWTIVIFSVSSAFLRGGKV